MADTSVTQEWLRWARELQAVAQSGLRYAIDPAFSGDEFDVQRYSQVRRIAAEMMAAGSDNDLQTVEAIFEAQVGDATPKIDVRGVVFDEEERVLLVRERLDGGRWTLPGGWADVNESPSQAVCREVEEESGLEVAAVRLLALWDRDRHDHPPHPFHSWKVFFECAVVGGEATSTAEAFEPTFWDVDDLPELSRSRVTEWQLRRLLALHVDPHGVAFD
jgi:ADP-ribose pyrophosphatase YjhB (NUDIX family)